MLYLIPTPIGNLGDFGLRSIDILQEVDLILVEDTRVSQKLLKHYEISKPLKSFHTHNEHAVLNTIIEQLRTGQKIAMITDAGTPGLSDPGFLLIKACIEHTLPYTVIPGPSALVPALVGSGLPSHRFHFEGFLPHKKGRQTRLKYICGLEDTVILYESPHRINKCLKELAEQAGADRRVVIVKEISKLHEAYVHGTLHSISEEYADRKWKGEYVIVLEGRTAQS